MEREFPFGTFQPGQRAYLFRFSFFFQEFSTGTNRRNVFHLPPNRNFRKFWLNGKRPPSPLSWFSFQNYIIRNECPMNHFGSLAAVKRLGTSLIAEISCFPSRLVSGVSLSSSLSLWVQKLIFKVRKNLMFYTVVKEGVELMLNAASLKYRSLFHRSEYRSPWYR